MRRIVIIVLSILLGTILLPGKVSAEGTKEAKAILLRPHNSEIVMDQKNSTDRYSVAGLCKIPALLTLCRAFDEGLIPLDTEMEVSQKASKVPGPTAFLEAGEQVRAGELIKAAVMISAGDAIWTLMENAFGSEEIFLQNIGIVLKDAGVDLTLETCLGTGTLFSCDDLYRLGELAIESKTFLQYAGLYMDSLSHQKGSTTELVNANRMIRSYGGCIGLLTGSSREDGYCGVFAAKRNEMTYLCCIIGSPTSEARFAEATQLLDNAFANYKLETPASAGKTLYPEWPVLYGDRKTVDLVPHDNVVLLRSKADGALEQSDDLPEALLAPLDPDAAVGNVTFTDAAGNTLAVVALYPSEIVRSNGYPDVIRRLIASYLE